MTKIIDRISDAVGYFAAWMFFVIAAMITYEVIARYMFLSPTIWAEEMSQFFQIWATYLAAAHVLRSRHLIRIDFLRDRVDDRVRRALDLLALVAIAFFAVIGCVYGLEIVIESIRQGRHTSTMLGVPNWMTESAIPVGMALLFVQTIVEAVRLFTDPGACQQSGIQEI